MYFRKVTFVTGLAVGYVLGAQAGRERYDQLRELAKKAAESPAMQQTAGALQAQASATAKTAKERAATGVRKGAAKVSKRGPASGRTPRTSAVPGTGSGSGTGNGSGADRRGTGSDDHRPFVPVNGAFGDQHLTP